MITHRISARPPNSPAKLPPTLLQFVLLSMLLHILLVVLFGTTTTGGVRRGESLLGSLDVTLRQLASAPGAGFAIAPGAETKLPGTALLRRLEGATKAAVTPTPREPAPIAAPRNAAATPASTQPVEAQPAEAAPPTAGEAVPDILLPPPPPVESLPKLDLRAPVEVDQPIVAPTVPPPQPEREISPPPVPPRREVTLAPITPLERFAPASIEQPLAPPIDLRPRETPLAPRAPAVELQPREEPQPVAAPAVEPPAPVKIEREATPPVEVKPRELPTPQRAPSETVVPARAAPAIEREAAPTPQPLPGKERATAAAAAPAKAPSRSEASPAAGELPRLRFGAPDVDEDVFRSRRDTAAPKAGGKEPVTLESMRKRAREIASEGSGSRGVLNLIPPPPAPERKDSLAEGIAKAAKPDCRTAYAGLGLLAVVPLVASSVGNGGCNW